MCGSWKKRSGSANKSRRPRKRTRNEAQNDRTIDQSSLAIHSVWPRRRRSGVLLSKERRARPVRVVVQRVDQVLPAVRLLDRAGPTVGVGAGSARSGMTAVRVITDLMRIVGIDSYDQMLPLSSLLADALVLPLFDGGNMGVSATSPCRIRPPFPNM